MPVDGIDFEFSASTLNAINEYATFKVVKVMTVNVRYYRIPYMLHWLLIPFVGTLENTLLGMLNEEMDSNLFAKVLGEIRKFSLIIKQRAIKGIDDELLEKLELFSIALSESDKSKWKEFNKRNKAEFDAIFSEYFSEKGSEEMKLLMDFVDKEMQEMLELMKLKLGLPRIITENYFFNYFAQGYIRNHISYIKGAVLADLGKQVAQNEKNVESFQTFGAIIANAPSKPIK